ncbi:ATP-binding cassette domain-containing protein [Teichococcus aestuarii]
MPHGAAAARAAIRPAPVLEMKGVQKTYQRGGWFGARATVRAIHDADFTLNKGETLGLVGESGSGKSTLARCVVRLVEPEQGEILFHGTDLRPLSRQGWLPYRRRIQMVFQDPYASLNPRRKVGRRSWKAPSPTACRAPRPWHGRASCCGWCGSTNPRWSATRTSSAAGSGSASAWPGRWRCSRSC